MHPLVRGFSAAVLVLAVCTGSSAQDKDEYQRRSVARFIDLFQSLDRDIDGAVTRSEALGDLNFSPRFDDMDINRDGIVTKGELHRYLELRHGMRPGSA